MITHDSRILVADDFAVVRLMLRRFLNDLGFAKIDEAGDGAEALHMVKEATQILEPYDILFLDLSMPKKTGLVVLQECRATPDLKDLPIILVTAESERKLVMQALSSGASDYVVKPFTLEIVKTKIENLNRVLLKAKAK